MSLNTFAPIIHNDGILNTRHSRINKIRKRRKQRNASRMYRERNQYINNEDVLNRIETLPIQHTNVQHTNDLLIDWFFNGSFL